MTWLHARRLPVLLAAATLIPVGALAWLGVRTLQQDRELDGQRRRERLEVAAARVALEIDRQLQDIEQELAAGEGVRFRADGIESRVATRRSCSSPSTRQRQDQRRHRLPPPRSTNFNDAILPAQRSRIVVWLVRARARYVRQLSWDWVGSFARRVTTRPPAVRTTISPGSAPS